MAENFADLLLNQCERQACLGVADHDRIVMVLDAAGTPFASVQILGEFLPSHGHGGYSTNEEPSDVGLLLVLGDLCAKSVVALRMSEYRKLIPELCIAVFHRCGGQEQDA